VQHGGGGGVVPATHLAGMVLLVWVPFAGVRLPVSCVDFILVDRCQVDSSELG